MDASVLLELKATAKDAKKEVKDLGRSMKQNLQQNLRSDIDINDSEIEKTKAKLELLEDDINTNLDIDDSSIDRFKDSAEDYVGGDQNRMDWVKYQAAVNREQREQRETLKKQWKEQDDALKRQQKEAKKLKDIFEDTYEPAREKFGGNNKPRYYNPTRNNGDPDSVRGVSARSRFGPFQKRSKDWLETSQGIQVADKSSAFQLSKSSGGRQVGPGPQHINLFRKLSRRAKDMADNIGLSNHSMSKLSQNAKKFGGHVKNIIPNMRTWWRLIGAMLPMMIALGVQAVGVAAALGSIAVAGGAVAGLGLLGSGQSLSESMENAKQQIQEVKRELFDTFQPVFQAFAPISDRFFGTLAERLRPLVGVMKELTAYEGAFTRLFTDVVGYAAMGIKGLVNRVKEFEQVGRRYLSSFVSTLSRFVQFLTKTMVEEQDAIMHLGQSFAAIINIVWQAIKVLSYVGVILRPIFEIASAIATLFSDKWTASITAMVVALYIYVAAISSAKAALAGLMKVNFAMWAGKFVGLISNLGLAIQALRTKFLAATWAARAFWTAATIGGAALLFGVMDLTQQALQPDTSNYGSGAGGMPGSGQAGSAPTYNTEIVVNGEMSKTQRHQISTIAENVGNETSERNDDRSF